MTEYTQESDHRQSMYSLVCGEGVPLLCKQLLTGRKKLKKGQLTDVQYPCQEAFGSIWLLFTLCKLHFLENMQAVVNTYRECVQILYVTAENLCQGSRVCIL